jgi:arylsulfatase A-like enzyme
MREGQHEMNEKRRHARDGEPGKHTREGHRPGSYRIAVRIGAVLLLAAAILPAAGCRRPPAFPKVFFLGIDGADWKVIGPLLQKGELPAFRRLIEEGAYRPNFETLPITHSPVIWTTVATGRAPEDHGVTSFTSKLPNGQVIPVTSSVRRSRAIWELASQRGVSVGVIGWWASWPAETVKGYVITDHASPAFSDLLIEDRRYWTADRDTLTRLQRDFLPTDLAPVLARHWISKQDFPYDEVQRRGRFTDAQIEALRAAPWNDRNAYSWIKTFYRVDEPLLRIALDLAHERPTDLEMLYLRGADPVQHYGWDLYEPEKFARKPPHLERDRGVVESVYRYLDTFLAEILEARPADSWLIVASDHGAEPAPDAQDPARTGRPGEHGPAAVGVFFIVGPHVKPGTVLPRGTPYDIMPTLAWLLGLPLADDLPGKPFTEAFEESFVQSKPATRVPTYGVRPTGPLLPSSSDPEMLKSLRNLGYIQ